jgi:choline kinase
MKRLAQADVSEVVVVCGHFSELLSSSLRACPETPPIRFVENPLFALTNSLVSLSLTRGFWREPFCVLDGDVLVTHRLLNRLLRTQGDILAVDTGKRYEDIDMKVRIHEGRVVDFGKDLPPSPGQGEFFGLSRWSPNGAARLSAAIDELIDAGHTDEWYEAAIRKIAIQGGLQILPATTADWAEVDAITDLPAAAALIERDETTQLE